MSTSDGGLAAMSIEGQAPAFSCGASDLKVILGAIADHIADADRRHSEALGAMQQRLAELGSQAKGMRAELPAEMQPALDRIEAGMAELSDKLASPDHSAGDHVDPHAPSPYALAAHAEPPAALRSVAAGEQLASFTRRDEVARAAVKPAVDTFDVVSFDENGGEEEPWDAASAEALTKLYESHALEMLGQGADGKDARSEDAGDVAPAAPAASARAAAAADAPPAVDTAVAALSAAHEPGAHREPSSSGDHLWLEQRFAEIALKLDSSLSAFNPDAGFGDLSSKFTRLEEQLTSVLADTPSRADLNSLKAIETQVEDLTHQLDTVHAHFSRLDSIEAELRTLSDRISEESLERMFERAAPRSDEEQLPRLETALQQISERLSEERLAKLAVRQAPAAVDTDTIARQVAAVLAPQLSSRFTSANSGDAERIDELHHLLTGFINERRHGDEQTTTMLDTMQQAMIRLLDRMDALETGGASSTAALEAELNRPEPFTDTLDDEPMPQARRRSDMPQASDEPIVERHHLPPSLPAERAALELRAMQPAMEMEPAPAPVPTRPSRPELVVDQDKPAKPAPSTREDFIASARRAARQAAQSPVEQETEETRDQEAPLAADPVVAPAKRAAAKAAGGRRAPSMLTIGLACLIVAGASFMVAKPYLTSAHNPPAGGATPVEAPQPASAQPKAPKPVEAEDGDEIIDKSPSRTSPDRGPPMTPPKRSSTTGPSSVGDSSPFDPGNGSISVGSLVDGNGNILSQRDLGIVGTATAARQQDLSRQMPVHPAALAPLSGVGEDSARSTPEMPPATIGPNSLRQAAMKGDPSAEFEIGARFAEGKGVAQDLKQAVSWYQRSASRGFAPAQYRYASMLERGLGVKADLAKASVWYQRAAEQGIVKAMHNLAVLSSGRDGVPADYALAMKWFTSASEYGLVDSQFNLAIMHENGLGVEKDNREAYKWFSLAARAGDAEASKRRDVVKAKLSASELREADAQIESWRAKMADNSINDARQAGEAWKQRAR